MRADRPVPAEHTPSKASWLCRDEFDRERMLDMEERVRPYRQGTLLILAIAIVGLAPSLGGGPLLFLIPAGLFFGLADGLMPKVARPENVMFAAWVGSELTIAGAVSLEGGPRVVALSWLAIPVMTLSSRFGVRGVVAGVAIACALMLAVAFGFDASAVVSSPELVVAPLAVVLIVADLDHFKNVNDTRGHTVGDVVLREVAYLLRKHLRAFDLAYRLGGEEFLILVPGADLESAADLAHRLREGVSADELAGGVLVTLSIGVAASAHDERFDYTEVFAEADAALYRAKREGRNRVCLAGGTESVPAAA